MRVLGHDNLFSYDDLHMVVLSIIIYPDLNGTMHCSPSRLLE